jgi:predicted O-methyltransferase YrrM
MTEESLIGIDECHCSLIYGLVVAQKPARVLEFGYGAGNSFRAIQNGLQYNENGAIHVLVDDWSQWGGVSKSHLQLRPRYTAVEVNTCTEQEYIAKAGFVIPFDFIVSDADHQHSGESFWTVYDKLLRLGGILIYHDVTNADSPDSQILKEAADHRLRCALFNSCSRSDERCERGLFVIFKP